MASKRARLIFVIGLWGAATAGGLSTIAAHGAAPGLAPDAPSKLSASFRSSLAKTGRATLIVAAHPACPCTRATFHELERILASVHGRRPMW